MFIKHMNDLSWIKKNPPLLSNNKHIYSIYEIAKRCGSPI